MKQRLHARLLARPSRRPRPKRDFKGVQLDATKRFSNNWQGMASYLYSKLDGNFDGEYAPFTNVGADPNITAAYDYYDFFTNGSDLDTHHQQGPALERPPPSVQGLGRLLTPWKLSLGAVGLLAHRHAAHALRLLRRLRPLRVLPHRARRRRAHARQLRRRPPPRLSDHARPGDGQHAARRLQRPQRPAPDPARSALGLPEADNAIRHPPTRDTAKPCCAHRRRVRGWG